MTRRRHFPSILQSMNGIDSTAWKQGLKQAERMHADAVLLPMPWAGLDSMAEVLGSQPLDIEALAPEVDRARKQRVGVFLEISLPGSQAERHTQRSLSQIQERLIRPLMALDLAGIVIRSGISWPAPAILELERLIRLKEGAVLFIDHGRGPDIELMDGQVDGVVDPTGVAGITRFLAGRCSGNDLGRHLMQQQERLGINLAGRVLNPLEKLQASEPHFSIGAGLSFALRGYPFLPGSAIGMPEHICGPLAQLRRGRSALEWGRFINLSPGENPDIFAFARADERVAEPVIAIARRAPGPAFSLPLGVGSFDLRRPFLSLIGSGDAYCASDGWLDLPAAESPELLLLGQ
jgi:hypothetical protein